ncbi:serine/threonine-protein kinase LMTK1-like isoform X1 [Scleropages formosus]|uniref:non-specific serine/threonine protein kinase n=2 Tax=Scleropages formosus TaxID=113540 RepID=A0A8C9S7J8_SCLFO|nr:serine/threonine-protein kinase LMTK1-like isoform X1 [Scleropages formosus]
MSAAVCVAVMSASFFNPSFAFSSHFDTDGAPLNELSWSSSLAVVAVSFSGLFTFIFLMLACLCCKKGDIGFKEFDNTEGEEYQTDLSALGSPTSQTGPEVYILPLTDVSVTVSKQPSKSVQLLKSSDFGRHSLLYLKDIGHGWFGKVLLGEVNVGHSTTQVVVKELNASASVQDQMQFLEEVQPYRALQHPALLQCLAQCTEVTPYLLVMEFCPLGDVKGYLRSCRPNDSVTPDPSILQRMACEIASGLLHLHKYNYIHSDLALRNCLLTADMTVKIGDYGLSHNKYKDDYFVTPDQLWVPLRWIAPEIIDEVHGNLLMVDQTKTSNIWSLGVTIWELFELGSQPYRHYSDRQVLTYAVKEQQLKLPKPELKIPLSERWYEVMQFCWLQPDQRPTAEEVHLLLGYLCAKGASEGEEDFEARWISLRPGAGHSGTEAGVELASSASSSFPLLEHFSAGDSFPDEPGDDILTVTETSHGLNFEYKWEQTRHEQPYCASSTSGPLGQSNPHYQDIYYPTRSAMSSCGGDRHPLGVSPSFYKSKELHTPGVVPVLSAHSPSVSSEYYIRIEEPIECNINLDYSTSDCSPGFEGSNSSFVADSGGSGNGMSCSDQAQPNSYWSTDAHKVDIYDSDASPAISPTMEPLLRQTSDTSQGNHWHSGQRFSYKDGQEIYYKHSPSTGEENRVLKEYPSESHQNSWRLQSLSQRETELGSPLSISPPLSSPNLRYCDPYLEGRQGPVESKSTASEVYHNMMGSLRKAMSGPCDIDIEREGSLVAEEMDNNSQDEGYQLSQREANKWTTNCSSNNNHSNYDCQPVGRGTQETFVDVHYSLPLKDPKNIWPEILGSTEIQKQIFSPSKTLTPIEATTKTNGPSSPSKPHVPSSAECKAFTAMCHEDGELPTKCQLMLETPPFDSILGSTEKLCSSNECIEKKDVDEPWKEEEEEIPSPSRKGSVTESLDCKLDLKLWKEEPLSDHNEAKKVVVGEILPEIGVNFKQDTSLKNSRVNVDTSEPASESSRTVDSGLEAGCSSVSMIDINDCSDDDDITDITSGIFTDFVDSTEVGGDVTVIIRSLRKQVGTPDSVDSIDLPSASGSCETFSPASFCPSTQSKAVDSGYDTENNESPEFILKDPSEQRIQDGKPCLIGSPVLGMDGADLVLQVDLEKDTDAMVSLKSHSTEVEITGLSDKNPYRDSAYFSDYDTENERWSREEGDFPEKLEDGDFAGQEAEKEDLSRYTGTEQFNPQIKEGEKYLFEGLDKGTIIEADKPESGASSVPVLSTLSPSPPEMGGCLTKESSQDEGLSLDSEQSGEEQSSECASSSSTVSTGSSTQQEYPTTGKQVIQGKEDSPEEVLIMSDSTSRDTLGEFSMDIKDEEQDHSTRTKKKEVIEVGGNSSWGATSTEHKVQGVEKLQETAGDTTLIVPIADGEDADEEDGDSDDSEESDEELGCYNIQEQSEESEEESPTVPIVVSDHSDARNLRSLLKMPTLLTESFCDDLDRKKKAVSFFDDVTVYLFDQESPTRDLVEPDFPPREESSGHSESHKSQPQERINASDDSSDGNISEESGGFEWEDDFPLMASSPATVQASGDAVACAAPSATPEIKPAIPFSRFSVSRFSITHVSDSDVESAGGSSEDGERE